ncbi:hypothetical protein ACA910_011993 [Epithemia clementina (nom. ined.)]
MASFFATLHSTIFPALSSSVKKEQAEHEEAPAAAAENTSAPEESSYKTIMSSSNDHDSRDKHDLDKANEVLSSAATLVLSDIEHGTTCSGSTSSESTISETPLEDVIMEATKEEGENNATKEGRSIDGSNKANKKIEKTPSTAKHISGPKGAPPVRPSTKSLIVACGYVFLAVSSFTIAIPSSIRYTTSFGVSQALSGVVVGILPLFGAFAQFPMIRIYERFSMTFILYSFLLLNIIANAFYALGGVTKSYTMVLIGRGISGIVGGPTFAKTYIARTTDKEHRLQYMEYLSVSISLAYALGPAMGVVIEVVCNKAGWDSALLNADTAVGWWCVFLFLLQVPHALLAFEEPPALQLFDSNAASTVFTNAVSYRLPAATEQRSSNTSTDCTLSDGVLLFHEDEEQHSPHEQPIETDGHCHRSILKKLFLWSLLVLLLQMNVGVFEVTTIYRATSPSSSSTTNKNLDGWSWDIAGAAGYLSIVNWIPVLLSLIIPIRRFVTTDIQGARGSFLLIIVASVFLFDYDAVVPSTIGQVSIYSIGSAILLFAIQTGKGFTFSRASKLPQTLAQKQPTMSTISFVYNLGRAMGSMGAPLLSSGQLTGLFFTVSNVGAFCILVLAGHLGPDE